MYTINWILHIMIFENVIDAYISNIPKKVYNEKELNWFINDLANLHSLKKKQVQIKDYFLAKYFSENSGLYSFKKQLINHFDIASSYSRHSFFSHGSALKLHKIDDTPTDIIYLTQNNYTLGRGSELTQKALDDSFRKPQRITTKIIKNNQLKIYLLSGQNHDSMITSIDGYAVTNLEKTLIDITIRPSYSRGSKNVLESFKKAKDCLDIEKLFTHYKDLKYSYPYHQSIGFYLEHAGYNNQELQKFQNLEKKLDFYIDYQIQTPKYSKDWKLYYDESILDEPAKEIKNKLGDR